MESGGKQVPWQDRESWSQVALSLGSAVAGLGEQRHRLLEAARQIGDSYAALDRALDPLCARTCANCTAVCCTKATVWYDLKDLLFLALAGGGLPEAQIMRSAEGCCTHLTATGCRLHRCRRPFICTWYVCADQKSHLANLKGGDGSAIAQRITRLQEMRKELEERFVAALRG